MLTYPLLFHHAQLVLPGRLWPQGWIFLADGLIRAFGEGDPPGNDIAGYHANAIRAVDLQGHFVMPGFIDLHTHGAGGYDFMDATAEAWDQIAVTHAAHGTTSLLATTLASSREELDNVLALYEARQASYPDRRGKPGAAVDDCHVNGGVIGASILGLHLEGPWFSPKQAGAQDPRFLRNPDPAEYRPLITNNPGIRRWSAAPELPGALEFGTFAAERGVIASIAHSDANYMEVLAAVRHGYSMVTHLYSGMSMVHRVNGLREAGVVESALILDELAVEFIADGFHLPAEIIRLIYRCKRPHRMFPVTDSMRAAGQGVTESILGSLTDGQPVLVDDQVARLPDGTALAGSIATGDQLLRTLYQKAGIGLIDAVHMMTAVPAGLLGCGDRKGRLAVGFDADLAVYDQDLRIERTIIGGRMTD